MQIKLSEINKAITIYLLSVINTPSTVKKTFIIGILISFFTLSQHALAQFQKNETLGNLKEYKFYNKGVNIVAANGFINITPYTSNIIRIHFSKQKITDNFSYAVIEKPQKVNCSLYPKPKENLLTLSTDSIDVAIQTNPLRFNFMTKNNSAIISDDLGLGISWIGDEITAYKKLNTDEKFIGLGEKTGHLNRKGEGYTNWNTDAYGYNDFQDPIYASIPFYIGVHDSVCYGVFVDNTSKSFFNFGAANNRFSSFTVENGDLDYYIIYGAKAGEIIKSYTWLTGRMPLPPKWSIGFQQCRYSYYPDTKVMEVANAFREKKIPCDMLYLDIDYMYRNRVFTWDSLRFKNPRNMLTDLKSMGFHTTTILDPGIAIADDYSVYKEAKSKDLFLKYPDGTAYAGEVWPGLCNFPDFTKPETRLWWGTNFKSLIADGVDGFWNDMNEPAMWGKHIPTSVEFDYDGRKATALSARNVYGMQMSRSTYEGVNKLLQNKRPFLLTRSAYAGIQRYSSIWTGDNNPTDDHMLTGVRLVSSLGLSGVPFAGADISGYTGDASAELYTRWMSIGVFTPLFRSHKSNNAHESEPWSYGLTTESIVRKYIEWRYRLMPYIYSTFYQSSISGLPVNRSLTITNTFQNNVYDKNFENQFMFGDALLIAPCKSNESLLKVYLPQGTWYDIYNDDKKQGNSILTVESPLNRLPVFVKGGSIIPQQETVQNTSEKAGDTLLVHIYFTADGEYTFNYYDDDGTTYDYLKSSYFKRTISFSPSVRKITFAESSGTYVSEYKIIKLYLHGFDNQQVMQINENKASMHQENLVNNLNNSSTKVVSLIFENKKDKIDIEW